MLKVTPAAISQMKEEMAPYIKDGKEWFIRLYMAIGWGKPNFELALEESAQSDDHIIEVDELRLLIAERDVPYFKGRQLDYAKVHFDVGHFQLQEG